MSIVTVKIVKKKNYFFSYLSRSLMFSLFHLRSSECAELRVLFVSASLVMTASIRLSYQDLWC